MADWTIKPQEFREGSGGHAGAFPELEPELRDAVIERFNENKRFFNGYLGMRLVDIKRGYAKLEIENVPHLCQPAMVMHGGASFGLADTSVAFALTGLYGFDKAMLTVEMKINYLERIPLGLVTAEAFVLRATPKSAYAEVDVWAAGKLAARATTTYIIRPLAAVKPQTA